MIAVKGLEAISDLNELVKNSPIKVIDLDIDDYGAGFDVIQENGNVIQIRVSTMPCADTSFYIKK